MGAVAVKTAGFAAVASHADAPGWLGGRSRRTAARRGQRRRRALHPGRRRNLAAYLADAVPGLNHIRFGDTETAGMVGDCSDQYPTGVFFTTDGGRKWRPVPGPRCTTWLGGDFLDGKTAALAGAWSSLGTLRDGNLGKADVEAFGGRDIRGMQIRQAKSFAVGQGGLVLESKTLGAAGISQDEVAAGSAGCLGFPCRLVRRRQGVDRRPARLGGALQRGQRRELERQPKPGRRCRSMPSTS